MKRNGDVSPSENSSDPQGFHRGPHAITTNDGSLARHQKLFRDPLPMEALHGLHRTQDYHKAFPGRGDKVLEGHNRKVRKPDAAWRKSLARLRSSDLVPVGLFHQILA